MNYVEKLDYGLFGSQGSLPAMGESFAVDVRAKSDAQGHGGPDTIVVPDAHLLFAGDYKRSGLDLVLSKDGQEFVAREYFRGESRATLASPDGANLSGKTVEALSGQLDYAQAGGDITPAKVIGQVTKMVGNATAIRNGVSITLNVGDNVNKGDVVQAGSDSSLGITFIDGTVFGLSSNARMVLNEMVYNPNASNNSSLLTLVQGTISFVAGATAKNGDMKVETPTATMGIRGTAVLVEIDFDIPQPGVAPPVSFRVLVEPNGTTGEYVLLDKLTLQPIATVNQAGTQTIVNGQGVVTFIASAQIPASAQQLINEIFSLKFTDANPKHIGIPPLDSITPDTFVIKLADGTPITHLSIPVTFVLVDTSHVAPPSAGGGRLHLNIPPELVASGNLFTERGLTTGNTALDTVSGTIRFADINLEDRPTVTAYFDSFVYRNAQQAIVTSSLTSEQLAAISEVDVPLVVAAYSDNTNLGGASWTYRVADHALDFLAAGETLTLTYMARVDTNYSEYNTIVLKPFTVTITGTNDLPTVAATGSGIIERIGTGNNVIDHAEGVITFADVDLTDRPTVTAPFANYVYTAANGTPLTLTPAQQATLAAALTLTPAATNGHNGSVAWSYDVADLNFDFIAAGETLVLTYTAIVDDGHGGVVSVPLTLTVSVKGTNDIPTITATSGGFVELVGMTGNAFPDHAGGTITFTDVDLTDRPVITAPFSGYTYTAANGTTALTLTTAQQNALAIALTLTPSPTNAHNGAVTWSYDLADARFDFLAYNETLVLTYTATVNDGHGGVVSTPITVTVTGTNDVPSVAVSDLTGAVLEAITPAGNLADTGTIAFTDVDLTDHHSINPTIVASSGALGTLTASVTTDTTGSGLGGVVTWNYSVPASAVEYLARDQIKVERFTITLNDGHGGTVSRTIEVTITGTNDVPVVATADLAGTVLEAVTPAGNLADTGTIAFTDVDLTDHHSINPTIVPSSGALGLLTASVTTDSTGSGLGGVVTWNYSVPASAVEYLAKDQIKVERFTITLNDGNGGTVSRTIEVTITGTNDIPVVATADLTGTVLEAVTPAGNLADTGTIAFADVDLTDHHSINPTIVPSSGALGTLTASVTTDSTGSGLGGVVTWNYSVPASAVEYLAKDQIKVERFTITLNDGNGGTVSRTIEVTITGTNDVPVVATADLTGAVLEAVTPAGNLTDTGTIAFTDVDLTDHHSINPTIVPTSGALGTLTASVTTDTTGSGLGGIVTWNYSVPASAVEYLAKDQIKVERFTITLNDGNGGTVSRTIEVTITGTNDIPVVATADLTGTVLEAVTPAGNLADTGTIAFTDVDLTDHHSINPTIVPSSGALGTLTASVTTDTTNSGLGGVVTWNYSVPASAVEYLAKDQIKVEQFTITLNDGNGGTVSRIIEVTITGTNDAPIVATADLTGTVLEAVTPTGNLTNTGTIGFTDVDLTDSHVINPTIVPSSGALGALTASVTTDTTGSGLGGVVTWNYSVPASSVEYLAKDQIKVEQFTITLNDGNGGTVSRTIEVTVTGTNDAPIVATADLTGTVLEAVTPAGNLTDTGTIGFTDVDLTDSHVINPTVVTSSGALGVLTASVTADTTNSGVGGVVTWNYSVAASAVEYLAKDEIKTEQFTITLNDGNGGTIDRIIEVTITGTNDDPVVATSDLTGTVLEAVAPTGNLTDTGTIGFTDADLTDGHAIDSTIVSSSGALGTLTADVTTDTTGSGLGGVVTWNYSVAAAAVEYLAKDQVKVEQFTVTLDDGHGGTIDRIIEVTITGTNDDPVVATLDLAGTVLEAITPAGNLTDTGTIVFTDVDLTDSHTIDSTIVSSSGALGTLTADVTTDTTGSGLGGVVTWNYSVAAAAVEYLAKDQVKVEQFTVTLDDGHGGTIDRIIELTITGTNDDPVVATSDLTGTVLEAVTPAGDLTDTGTIGFTDVDLTDSHVINPTVVASSGALGALTASVTTDTTNSGLGGVVTWTYSVPASAVEYLAKDQIKVEQFTITLNDGNGGTVSRTIEVTVTGTNDAPIVATADLTGAVLEAVTPTGNLTDTGTIGFTDVDLTDSHVINPTVVTSSGALGALTASVTSDTTNSGVGGVVTWNYSVAASAVEYLAKDEIKTEQFTITLNDGNGGTIDRIIEVTITGTNDDPVVATSDLTGTVLEAVNPTGNLTDTGTIGFTDADLTDGHTIDSTVVSSSGALGTLTADVTTDTTGSGLGGVVTWNYSVAAAAVEYLAKDQVKIEQFTVTLDDGHGGTIDRIIEVTITGTNDDPVVATSDLTGTVLEAVTPTGHLTDTGTIAFTDVDLTDGHTIDPTIVASSGALGALTADVTTDSTGTGFGGVVTWNYSVAASAVEYLAKDEIKTEQFTITLDDGHGGVIEVAITGTNDAVTIDPIAPVYLSEQADTTPLSETIPVTFTDVDLTDVGHTAAITHVAASGTLGNFAAVDDPALIALMTTGLVNKASGSASGSLDLDFTADSTVFDYLEDAEAVTLAYTLEIDDHHGGVTTHTAYVHINGVSDLVI